MLCGVVIYFPTFLNKRVLGVVRKKGVGSEMKERGREKKESERKKIERKVERLQASVILYAKCWPEAKCHRQPTNGSLKWKKGET